MCVPAAIGQGVATAFGLGMDLVNNYQNTKAEQKNLQYKTQIALNNAQTAKNEALRQQQLGIDEARKEKIEGLRQANLQMAKNSANGMDLSSTTIGQNYQDVLNTANNSAQDIQNSYNLKADSYFDKANDYMGQINEYKSDYNNYAYKNAINSLGSVGKVATNWYSNMAKEQVKNDPGKTQAILWGKRQ